MDTGNVNPAGSTREGCSGHTPASPTHAGGRYAAAVTSRPGGGPCVSQQQQGDTGGAGHHHHQQQQQLSHGGMSCGTADGGGWLSMEDTRELYNRLVTNLSKQFDFLEHERLTLLREQQVPARDTCLCVAGGCGWGG
jgi:hypothetical protein